MNQYLEERVSNPVFDKQLIAIARCQEAMEDFANFERWQILDYLAVRYGRVAYVRNPNFSEDQKL